MLASSSLIKPAPVAERSLPRVKPFGMADAIFMIARQRKTSTTAVNAKNSLVPPSKNGHQTKIPSVFRI